MAHRNPTTFVMLGIIAIVIAAVSSPAVSLAQSATASAKKAIQEVLVSNDAAHPVPVQTQGITDVNVVNAQAVMPVQKTAFGTFPAGNRFSDDIELYTVPAGKQLIIESVTVASNLSGPDQHLMHVLFSATSGDFIPYTINVQPVAEGVFSQTGANVFRATQQITAYAGPGTVVSARGTRDGAGIGSLDSLGVGLAGRLVNVP
jgi:hypothetical protein